MASGVNKGALLVLSIAAVLLLGAFASAAQAPSPAVDAGKGGIYGGTLRVAVKGPLASTLDPATATDDGTWNVMYRIFDTLLVIDPATLDPIPWMTSSIGAYDSGAKKLTLTISDGITFHKGTAAVTGADVKASFDKVKSNPRFSAAFANINSVDASGKTVTFTFKGDAYAPVYYEILAKLPVMPASYDKNNPVGSGPFMYKSKTSSEVVLEKNPSYFKLSGTSGPYVDSIQFKVYAGSNATSVAVDDVKSGAVDYVMWALDTSEIGPGIPTVTTQDISFYYMGFNMNHAVMQDYSLRYAFSLCVDKKTTVVQSINNFGSIASGPVSKGLGSWYNESLPNDYVWIRDVNGDGKIEELDTTQCLAPITENLTKSGYKDVNGDGRRDLPGSSYPGDVQSFNVTALAPSTALNPNEDRITSSVITNIRNVGINIIDDVFSTYSERDTLVDAGSFDIYFDAYTPSGYDPSYLYDLFHTSGAANKFGYSNSALDAKLVSANKEMDMTKRKALVKEIQSIVVGDLPIVSVYYPFKIESVATSFIGWNLMPGGIGNYRSFLDVHKPVIGSLALSVKAADGNVMSGGASNEITFTVKSGETAISGATVTITASEGMVTPSQVTTDSSGIAKATFTAPSPDTPTTVEIDATAYTTQYNDGMSKVFITVNPASAANLLSVEVSSVPSVKSGAEETVTVTVTGADTLPVQGAQVNLSVLYMPASGVTITPASGITDASGVATFKFKAAVDTDTLYTLQANAAASNYTAGVGTGQIQVTAQSSDSGDIPGPDAAILVGAICVAFAVFTVASRRKKAA